MTQTIGLKPPNGSIHVSRAGVAGAAVLGGIFLILFWDFFRSQFLWAVNSPSDWGHTLVVPGIAAWLAYRNRHRILARPFRTTWTGLAVILVGISWYMMCVVGPIVLNHHNLKAAGVMLTLGGLTLLFTGWRVTLLLLFPLGYLAVFGQTISERLLTFVTFPLQDITTIGAQFVLGAFAEIERHHNVLEINLANGTTRQLNVAEACSGMRMLVALLALGVAMAYVGLRHNWQRVLLVILGVPVAILVNVLRVVTLSALSIANQNFAAGNVESFIGVLWLVPAYLMYLGLLWVIGHVIVEPEVPPKRDPAIPDTVTGAIGRAYSLLDRRARIALVTACATLLVSFVGMQSAVRQLNIYLRKEAIPAREHLIMIPKKLGEWTAVGLGIRFNAAMVEELGTDEYLVQDYVNSNLPGRPRVQLHLAYYTGMIDAVPHVPERCFTAGGLNEVGTPHSYPLEIKTADWVEDENFVDADGRAFMLLRSGEDDGQFDVRMPFGEFRLRTSQFSKPDDPHKNVFAGYNFITNGNVVDNTLKIRVLAFDRSSRFAYYCKVQFTMQGGPDLDADRFIKLTSDLYRHLLPELMQCLPDWAEVEGHGSSSDD